MGGIVDQIQAWAQVLGGPGLFIVAFLDSSFLSLPEVVDLLLIWMVARHEPRMAYYAGMSTAGSVLGCLVLYYVGRKGDRWISKKFSAERKARTMATFQKYGVMAVLIPSLLPPPAPFKVFVLFAGIADISVSQFTLALTIGRGIRYFGEGLLALWYGDVAIEFVRNYGREIGLILVVVLAVGMGLYLLWRRAQSAKRL